MIEIMTSNFGCAGCLAGEYLVITSSNTHILADYEEEDGNTKNNYNNALTNTLDLIKGTNVLKT